MTLRKHGRILESLEDIALEILSGESTLGFYWGSRSTYWEATKGEKIDYITLGVYHRDGGTSGEFTIKWAPLGKIIAGRIDAFDDCWHIFPLMPDLFKMLADLYNTPVIEQPDRVVKELMVLGWRDLTRYDHIRRDEFEQRLSYGKIPPHFRPILNLDVYPELPYFTHYTSIRSNRTVAEWACPRDFLITGDVIFTTSEEDAALLFLHCV